MKVIFSRRFAGDVVKAYSIETLDYPALVETGDYVVIKDKNSDFHMVEVVAVGDTDDRYSGTFNFDSIHYTAVHHIRRKELRGE